MLVFEDLRDWTWHQLSAGLQYTRKPVFDPGPWTDTSLQKIGPNELVFLDIGGGTSRTVEGVFRRVFLNVRVAGRQQSYDSARDLAYDIHRVFLAVDHNTTIGTAKILGITQAGGEPAVISKDTADRYHFNCSYVVEEQADQYVIVN